MTCFLNLLFSLKLSVYQIMCAQIYLFNLFLIIRKEILCENLFKSGSMFLSCHVQNESTVYSYLNIKELLARNRREI